MKYRETFCSGHTALNTNYNENKEVLQREILWSKKKKNEAILKLFNFYDFLTFIQSWSNLHQNSWSDEIFHMRFSSKTKFFPLKHTIRKQNSCTDQIPLLYCIITTSNKKKKKHNIHTKFTLSIWTGRTY